MRREAEARRLRRSKKRRGRGFHRGGGACPPVPRVAFRGDDARRRAWVIGSGLDVWEIVQMAADFGSTEKLVAATQLTPAQVRIALAYREVYRAEVDEAVADNRRPRGRVADPGPVRGGRRRLSSRLLLDTNLSATRIGGPLAARGHVLSPASDATLSALDDPQVLELAAAEGRVLVTRNSRDFAPLLREWAEADRHHAGCILIWTLAHHQFGPIIRGVAQLLDGRPDPAQWRNLSVGI